MHKISFADDVLSFIRNPVSSISALMQYKLWGNLVVQRQ